MPKLYKIITYGCQMNVHESEKLAGMLKEHGYESTEDEKEASCIILNTCCVRESAETHVFGNLGSIKTLKEKNRNLKVVVCGCMTQNEGTAEKLKARCPFINLIFGTHNLHKFSEYLTLIENNKKLIDIWKKEDNIVENVPIFRTSGVNAWVNIMYGCNNFCSYCIVPYVRGRERSRKQDDIVNDVTNLVKEGYAEITLLGQNVNSYGNDLTDETINFANLLKILSEIEGTFRIRFMTSHPKDLSEEVVKVISTSDKLCKYFHIPVQSGSDNVLMEMNRKYTRQDYLNKIDIIRRYIPNAGISGDIMVGFPGETEQDILDTIDLIKKVRFNNLYTFIYSKRSGTPAAKMTNQIEASVKKKRIMQVIDAQFLIANDIASNCIGKEFNVLCTEFKNGNYLGKTDCEKVVSFKSEENVVGQFLTLKITKSKNSKLIGEIIK